MKVIIDGKVEIRRVLTEHGKFFYLDMGQRIYCQKLRSGLLVPLT
jgi:hypothetical protein